jgi:hypothetical protein
MCLVTIYLGCEVDVIFMADYDEQLLLPLLLEAYKGLLPNRRDYLDESTSLVDFQDLFQQVNTTVKRTRTLYAENLVHSFNILLMQKLIHVL